MTSLFGAFWISPEGELHETLGKMHTDYIGGLQQRTDAIRRGWTRIRSKLQASGLELYIEGTTKSIESAKDVIIHQWGHVPKKIIIETEENQRIETTPQEFYNTNIQTLVHRMGMLQKAAKLSHHRSVYVRPYRRRR